MGVITVAEQKGGIGKTTLAVGIAQYLSEIEHKSVLFVPLDNQGRTAKRVFDLKDNLRVLNGMFFDEPYDIQQVNENLSSLYSDRTIHNLDRAEIENSFNFAREIEKLKTQYDYIVIDTPPGLGARITAAVLGADHIVVPLECTTEAIEGMVELRDTIRKLTRFNPRAKINSLVVNKFNNTQEQREIYDFLAERFGDILIDVVIPDVQPIKTAGAAGRAIWHQARNGNHRKAAKIVKSVISRIVEKVN
ncbi:ParA family protein [Enterobacter hormaechei]|uniref:ParA family protein n=1 Tax=Enterobacter hormaechei TaxID=158836 RepID=UPI000794D130|nr:ParA family protein [Enterobacter hormaechei]EJB6975045.1 ParA family protein [Enterobacter hormaechei]SAF63207.1 Chromosome (plasmid) partitioning protein ParA %2C Sporulation initiation inhibitor protein Soj [Enterobacter hormaechei]